MQVNNLAFRALPGRAKTDENPPPDTMDIARCVNESIQWSLELAATRMVGPAHLLHREGLLAPGEAGCDGAALLEYCEQPEGFRASAAWGDLRGIEGSGEVEFGSDDPFMSQVFREGCPAVVHGTSLVLAAAGGQPIRVMDEHKPQRSLVVPIETNHTKFGVLYLHSKKRGLFKHSNAAAYLTLGQLMAALHQFVPTGI